MQIPPGPPINVGPNLGPDYEEKENPANPIDYPLQNMKKFSKDLRETLNYRQKLLNSKLHNPIMDRVKQKALDNLDFISQQQINASKSYMQQRYGDNYQQQNFDPDDDDMIDGLSSWLAKQDPKKAYQLKQTYRKVDTKDPRFFNVRQRTSRNQLNQQFHEIDKKYNQKTNGKHQIVKSNKFQQQKEGTWDYDAAEKRDDEYEKYLKSKKIPYMPKFSFTRQ